MEPSQLPKVIPAAQVVLIGGGHAHVEVIRRYGMLKNPPFQLTLISDTPMASYSGMLPGVVATHYEKAQAHIDLGHLCLRSGVRFISGSVANVDIKKRQITISGDRPTIGYESVSFDIGARPNIPDLPGIENLSIPVKPVDFFLQKIDELDRSISKASADNPIRIVIMGGGVAGCELALALNYRWSRESRLIGRYRIKVVESEPSILSSLPSKARRAMIHILRRFQTQIASNMHLERFDQEKKSLIFNQGATVEADSIFWTTTAIGHPWLRQTGLQLDEKGFILVKPTLETLTQEGVYAVGDVASLPGNMQRPKAGVFAVRQGPILFENLWRRFRGLPAVRYRPQKHHLALISLGAKRALAVRGQFTWQSKYIWRWKDHIDKRFMEKFQVPPGAVKVATYIESGNLSEMPCTACGSKLPLDTLRHLPVPNPRSREIVLGMGERDDCSVLNLSPPSTSKGQELLLTQSLDYVRAFSQDLFLVGEITATHGLNDLYAMGLSPHSAHVLATVTFGPKESMGRDLAELMAGVQSVFKHDNVHLLGGHSQAGFQAGVGMMVQSLKGGEWNKDSATSSSSPYWTKKGLLPGDQLILTKPLGSGLLLAGGARFRVSTSHLYEAFAIMAKSHRAMLAIAKRHQVKAATDVTGFGLASHLNEMCQLSKVLATINLAAIPTYRGVFRAIEDGIRSSLHTQNRQSFAPILRGLTDRSLVMAESLFDPQTSGGILLAVRPEASAALLAELKAEGYSQATIIGHVDIASGPSENSVHIRIR